MDRGATISHRLDEHSRVPRSLSPRAVEPPVIVQDQDQVDMRVQNTGETVETVL